jgi:hypothetical protein
MVDTALLRFRDHQEMSIKRLFEVPVMYGGVGGRKKASLIGSKKSMSFTIERNRRRSSSDFLIDQLTGISFQRQSLLFAITVRQKPVRLPPITLAIKILKHGSISYR